MKRIIDGKIYNTKTATLIGSDESTVGNSDFRWYDEDLFRTAKGQYFLYGAGGPMTRWAKYLGGSCNSRTDGIGIVLLTDDEALEWAERCLKPALIEEHFQVTEG